MEKISRERAGAVRALAKGGARGIPIAALGALGVTALAAYAAHTSARSATRPSLSAAPSQQEVAAGSPARYRIAISRRGFRGAIELSVAGAPRYARPRLTAPGSSIRMLTVVTSEGTPSGRYRLVVRARQGTFGSVIRLGLTVRAPNAAPLGVSGALSGLEPGFPQPLDLALRNRSAAYLRVARLTVTAKSLSAPRSTALLACTLADFSIRQSSGPILLVLPPFSTRTLSGLRVPPAEWPQVMLLDRPLDQDGCQGATVTLAYAVRAVTV